MDGGQEEMCLSLIKSCTQEIFCFHLRNLNIATLRQKNHHGWNCWILFMGCGERMKLVFAGLVTNTGFQVFTSSLLWLVLQQFQFAINQFMFLLHYLDIKLKNEEKGGHHICIFHKLSLDACITMTPNFGRIICIWMIGAFWIQTLAFRLVNRLDLQTLVRLGVGTDFVDQTYARPRPICLAQC